MKKTFGIIGAGNIGKTVAKHLVKAGYPVKLSNSSGPDSLNEVIASLGNGASAVTPEVAAAADITLLALPWTQLPSLTQLIDWKGRIVIDATNQFLTHGPEFTVEDLGGKPSSAVVESLLPGAIIVKAFNTLYYKILEQDPVQAGGRRVIFISGDHEEAKQEVRTVIEAMGFAVVDLGTLASGSHLQHPKAPLATLNLIKLS
jgi:8-hydroxy-5-deazaflavin:NADPH oxidoreductase